jgi:uncharacterized protein (TIRG00374 family)
LKRSDLLILTKLPIHNLLLLVLFGLIPLYILGVQLKYNISIFNLKLPFYEWFGLAVCNTMYNYLLPARSGLALRALYLKKKYEFPYSKYLVFLAGANLINFLIASFIAVVVGLILSLKGQLEQKSLFFISISLLSSMSIIFFLLLKIKADNIKEKNKFFSILKSAAEGIQFFKNNFSKVKILCVLQIILILSLSFRLFFAFYILNIEISFIKILFIQSLIVFSMILSITPGNLGIKEGIIVYTAYLLGITFDEAFLGAVLDRIIDLFLIFVFGVFYSNKLLFKVNELNDTG